MSEQGKQNEEKSQGKEKRFYRSALNSVVSFFNSMTQSSESTECDTNEIRENAVIRKEKRRKIYKSLRTSCQIKKAIMQEVKKQNQALPRRVADSKAEAAPNQ